MSRRRMMAMTGAALLAGPKGLAADAGDGGTFLRVDGRFLHYARLGDGPPLVLLHGASGNLRDWTFQLAPRLARTFTVIAFDRPGLGLSQPASDRTSLRGQVALMRAGLRALGIERYGLAGHSYGGSVALQWALDHGAEVAGLALFAAPNHPWPGKLEFYYRWANTPVAGWLIAAMVPLMADEARVRTAIEGVFAPQPVPEGYFEHICAELTLRRRVFDTNAKQVGALRPQVVEMAGRYHQLKMPLEIVHGGADTIVPAAVHSDRLAGALPHARYTRIEGMGHAPHNADPDMAVAAITRMMAG